MFLKDRISVTSKREYTDEGFLRVPARIARTGIQEYYAGEMGLVDRDPMDVIRIYRPPEEVFNTDSMKSFANKPVTDNHPPELVNADNSKKYNRGFSAAEVVKDNIFLKTDLTVTDAELIKKIKDGKVELSNGYTSDIEWKSGISPDGVQYDAIQKNIKGNHIAFVDRGRCGAACRVSDSQPKVEEEPTMATITIDGVEYEVSDQAKQAVTKLQVRLADAESEAENMKEDMEKEKEDKEKMEKDHQKSLDSLQAQFDDSQSKIPNAEMLDQLVANRIATRDAALKINPDFKFEGKDCETIRKEIVADNCSDVDVESASVDYIRARFDALTDDTSGSSTLDGAFQKHVQTPTKDGQPTLSPSEQARQRMIDRSSKLWDKNAAGGDK